MEGGVLELDVGRFNRHAPAAGHRVSRIDDEVHHDLLQLTAIGERQRERGRQRQRDVDVLADQPAEHAGHVRDQAVHVERRGVQHLLAAERQQLLGEAGGALAGLDDFAEILRVLARRSASAVDELGESEDDRQQIVEIVRDAGGQSPDRFHLARLTDLRFERAPFGDVLDDRDEMLRQAVGVAVDRHVDPGPHEAAVVAPIAPLVDDIASQRARGQLTKRFGLALRCLRLEQPATAAPCSSSREYPSRSHSR